MGNGTDFYSPFLFHQEEKFWVKYF